MALMWARPEPPVSHIDQTPAVMVTLVEPPPPPPPPPPVPAPDPAPIPAPKPEASSPSPGPKSAPPATAPKPLPPVPRASRPRRVIAQPPLPLLGAAQLAGAMTAGPGSGGGDGVGTGGGGDGSGSGAGSGNGAGANGGRCDMVRRVQDRLRRTPSVRTAVSEAGRSMNASGRAILVWDGDWLQSQGQSGKGLAGVRQAIALEVAFSPPECKTQAMHGLAVLSIEDGPDGARLALGKGSWRWSDLLGAG